MTFNCVGYKIIGMKYLVKNLEQTKDVATQFASALKEGDVVVLSGDLGAGKTTFTQFVFKSLGVEDVVNSPTFAVLKTYKGKEFTLNHFDTYRITVEEAIECGFDEVLSDRSCITFIEWASMIEPLVPQNNIKVNIKIVDENTREIEILR